MLAWSGWSQAPLWPSRESASAEDTGAHRARTTVKNLAGGDTILILGVYPLMVKGARRLLAVMTRGAIGWLALTDAELAGLPLVSRACVLNTRGRPR